MNKRFLNIYDMSEDEAIELLDTPSDKLEEDDIRYVAAAHLVNFDTDRARAALIRAVERKDQDLDNRIVRRKALESLGRLRATEAIPTIVSCLAETDRFLIENAVWALGEMNVREKAILSQIADLLQREDQSYRVILQTLRKLEYKEGIEKMKDFISHSDPSVSSAAIAGVAYLTQDFSTIDRLIDLLWHQNPMVRRLAIQDIVDAQYKDAIPAIACAPVSLVFRIRGIKLLAESHSLPIADYQPFLEQCLLDHPSTIKLIHSYSSLPPIERLIHDLYDTDFGKCYLATLTIINHYRETAPSLLMEEMADQARSDYGANYHMIKLFGWLRYSPSYEILIEALHNTQPQFQKSRSAAAISLGELGDTRAIDHLTKYLNSDIWELNYCANWAYQKLTAIDR